MRIGSMFSGIGGLDLACEWSLGGDTVWQLDQTGHEVRRRHWPDALQVVGDVGEVDPATLPGIDVLAGGFPCQDLSQAGTGTGLSGKRSGLYVHMLRFAEALQPRLVVMENVPGLLKYRDRLERDWHELGYGLTWVKCRALDAGAPHIRRRVFVIAERGQPGRGVVDADRSRAWTGDDARWWSTPSGMAGGQISRGGARKGEELLGGQVRTWPTATASNPNESEDPRSHAARSAALVARGSRPVSEPLGMAARTWPTATDHKTAGSGQRRGQLGEHVYGMPGKRLNPDWVEALMGFPVGWTVPSTGMGEPLGLRELAHACRDQRGPFSWPRGRYPSGWDRAQPWPGFSWEPSRTLPDGARVMGRPARLRGLGNAVCPQQGALAIQTWLDWDPEQGSLF